jgi:cation transport ATPase
MEQLKPIFEPVERLLELGGVRKDVAFIVVSAIALVVSFFFPTALPFDAAWVAIVLCGLPIVVEAVIALVTEFDIKADVLVSLALIASVAIGQYFAAGEVAVIMQLGGLLEELTVARAQKGIQKLVELTPRTARVVAADGTEAEIAADDVALDQVVRVLPGETVPVDGVVVSGSTSVDESAVTGEPMPVDKQAGSEVASGTTNQFGAIDVRATRVGQDSSIQRMARLVQSADACKAKIVRLADRWATWVVVGALVSAVGVWLVTGEILRAVTVLVVFCPCSLVLATPTAIVAAIGNATKHGFLVKEGDALERLAKVKRVVFDKTGTITEGQPRVASVVACEGTAEVAEVAAAGAGLAEGDAAEGPLAGAASAGAKLSRDELYALVAAAEVRSEHPLGRAIVRCAREEGVPIEQPESFDMQPGRGVVARVGGHMVAVGNEALIRDCLASGAAGTAGAGLCELSLAPTKSNGTASEVAKSNSTASEVAKSNSTSSKAFAESNGTTCEVAKSNSMSSKAFAESNGTASEVAKSNSTSFETFAGSNSTSSKVISNTNSDSSGFAELQKLTLALMAAGDTVTYVAIDGEPAGVVALSDTIRREARRTVKALAAAGAEPVLLTGDTAAAARTVANLAGISEVVASCKPEDKMAYIQKSEAVGVPCAMIGDGINDAPALRRAYAGIAVGGVGADVAVEAADIAIVNGSISEVPHLVALSRHMMRVIKANLTFSMTLNFVAIVLAFIAVLDPVSGALVHNCGSVFVIVNSAFLLSWTKR